MPENKNTNIGVYVTLKEKAEIEAIAKKSGFSKHALYQFGIRYFLAAYRKDKKVLKIESKKVLSPPE